MNKVVALIPARQKSVRVKNKNLKKICKQPLLWWTLTSAKKSKYIDEIYVSSDSQKILTYSKKQKAKLIKRPKIFSNNLATKKEVINHALNYLKKKDKFFDYLIYLQPTSPLRTHIHIDDALKKIFKKKLPGLISVKKGPDESLWAIKVKGNKISNDIGKNKNFKKRSQDLKKIYRPNGAIYIFDLKKMKYMRQFDTSRGFGIYEMDKISSIDIDDNFDFEFANMILSKKIK
tara:strand:- start:94 stop:789 length:696 start_codon:yes stop_codon:yes gene_type:complete